MILDDASRTTILIHYYRAMVGRADIWRVRMDTTTNWAIGATAALISFSLGNAVTPHYVVYLSSFLTVIFLLLEARRLTFYHLWQQRVFLLERALIQPAAQPDTTDPPDSIALDELALQLEPHLGSTAPTMSLTRAVARRLRRVYLYLFAVQFLAWVLKLSSHPEAASSMNEVVARAHVGPITGVAVMASAALALVLAAMFAALGGRGKTEGDVQGPHTT